MPRPRGYIASEETRALQAESLRRAWKARRHREDTRDAIIAAVGRGDTKEASRLWRELMGLLPEQALILNMAIRNRKDDDDAQGI